jgi:hypothetical protein
MTGPVTWQSVLLGLGLLTAGVLLVVWWRQQSGRWALVLLFCLLAAPALSHWSGLAFQVEPYRAGCDGLCPGSRGAPVPTHTCEATCEFLPVGFAVNTLAYLVILLAWGAVVQAIQRQIVVTSERGAVFRFLFGAVLFVGPFALSPLYLPPPEAHVRGDPQRVAINAEREVFMYDDLAALPILRVALEDVRPRPDDQAGLRVCMRTYSYFYMPSGYIYLDMTPEGVHSNQGGVLPVTASCWR